MAKSEKDVPAGEVETRERAAWPLLEPFGFGELLRWPERFGRWPDLFGEEATMRVEEYVEDGELHIRAEIPGVDPEKDIDITVDRGRIAIRAEREERTEKTEDGYRSEFRYGSYRRILPLPEGADADDVTAKYEDGILDLRVPIDTETKTAKKISITNS